MNGWNELFKKWDSEELEFFVDIFSKIILGEKKNDS